MKNATVCPYDGDFCDKKQERLNEWKDRNLRLSNPVDSIPVCPNMFDDCPDDFTKCQRYKRYTFIVNKVMDMAKQDKIK
jgi:hypothetical protein